MAWIGMLWFNSLPTAGLFTFSGAEHQNLAVWVKHNESVSFLFKNINCENWFGKIEN